MIRIRRTLALFVVLAVLTSACATGSKPFVVTGESLDQAGKLFLATGHSYNEALDSKTITADQYRPWAHFARSFKQAFPLAVQGWNAARLANDQVAEKKIADAIVGLVTQLTKFGLEIYEMVSAKVEPKPAS